MTRTLTTLSILAFALFGCDGDGTAQRGLKSTLGLSSGVSKANYGPTTPTDDPLGYEGDEDYWDFLGGVASAGTPIDVQDGELMGDYGFHTISESMVASVEGFSDGPWTEVNLMVETPSGISMAIFEVWAGLEELETGVTRTFDRWDSEIHGAYISVIGCTGQVAYEWDYDDAAMTVEVAVSQHPMESTRRVYAFTAYFEAPLGGAPSVLSGRFVGP